MDKNLKLYGPVEVYANVRITDGNQNMVAKVPMELGDYPSSRAIRERVEQFEKDEIPEGYRLMTKREFWNDVMEEYSGTKVYK